MCSVLPVVKQASTLHVTLAEISTLSFKQIGPMQHGASFAVLFAIDADAMAFDLLCLFYKYIPSDVIDLTTYIFHSCPMQKQATRMQINDRVLFQLSVLYKHTPRSIDIIAWLHLALPTAGCQVKCAGNANTAM